MKGFVKVITKRLKSGAITYSVSGTVAGQRIQKQFNSHSVASAEADRINGSVTSAALTPKLTRFTHAQLADAEAAHDRLPPGYDLMGAVQFFNANFRPTKSIEIEPALRAFLRVKQEEDKNVPMVLKVLECDLSKLFRDQAITSTADLTADRIKRQVYAKGVSQTTSICRFQRFNRFCNFLVAKNWLLKNPLEEEKRPREEDRMPPTILTVDQCEKLLQMAWTDPRGSQMLPYFLMTMFTGIRPTEMMRAQEHQFFLDEGHPIFEVWKGKTAWRSVELVAPLPELLMECRNRGLNLCHWRKKQFDRVREDAGVFSEWDNDILRHTFASYYYAKHRDVKWLASNMGNSEKVLFRNYIRRTVRPQDAEKFFALRVDFAAERRVAISHVP